MLTSATISSAMMINLGAVHSEARVGDAEVAEGFEAIMGLLCEEMGFQDFVQWVKKTFGPVLEVVQIALDEQHRLNRPM